MTDSEVAFIMSFMSSLNMLFTIAKILCVIVLITMTLIAANTAAMSVREGVKRQLCGQSDSPAKESLECWSKSG